MIASAAEQALVPSAAGFHVGYCDQRLRAHLSRLSTPGGLARPSLVANSRFVGL